MTDDLDDKGRPTAAAMSAAAKWVGVGMGIGSAALVAALLYARRPKPATKPVRPPREAED